MGPVTGILLQQVTTLTAAQIIAANATGVSVVSYPADGPAGIIVPVVASFDFLPGTVAFTGSTPNLTFLYGGGNTALTAVACAMTGSAVFGNTATKAAVAGAANAGFAGDVVLTLSAAQSAGNGTLRVKVKYFIHPTQ
jgi:hypothetical protein